MIQEIVQIQEIDILHVDLLILNHLQLHVDHLKILVLDFSILIKVSVPIELHHVQGTLTFITNEETLDLLTVSVTGIIVIGLFLDQTVKEIDSILEITFFLSAPIKTTFQICVCI